jgi:general secretion pathway protein K
MKDERGFALLTVMLVLTLLTVVVIELAVAMRLEAAMSRSFKEQLLALHLAEAGVHQAIREIQSEGSIQATGADGQLAFYRVASSGAPTATRLPALPRTRVPLGRGEFSYRISDEEGRLNVNSAPTPHVDRLLQALGVEKRARDTILDALEDWKDADDLHRMNGAESADYYLRLPVPYRARNAPLQDTAELLQIRGVTSPLYHGHADRPGLAHLVTVLGRRAVNINTAAAPVLASVGLSNAEIADVVQSRAQAPFTTVPGRFSGRGLTVGSATFRIVGEGWVGGVRKASVLAVVQWRGARGAATSNSSRSAAGLVTLMWRAEDHR